MATAAPPSWLIVLHLDPLSFPTRRSSDLKRRHRHHLRHQASDEGVVHRQHQGGNHHRRNQQDEKALFSQSLDRKSTRLNSSHVRTSYAVFCLKKKKPKDRHACPR